MLFSMFVGYFWSCKAVLNDMALKSGDPVVGRCREACPSLHRRLPDSMACMASVYGSDFVVFQSLSDIGYSLHSILFEFVGFFGDFGGFVWIWVLLGDFGGTPPILLYNIVSVCAYTETFVGGLLGVLQQGLAGLPGAELVVEEVNL